MVLGALAFWYSTGGHLTTSEIGVLAPIATFSAAGAALWIAGRDRRDRRQERREVAIGQARLVIINAEPKSGNRLGIYVDNYGREPIRDVEFQSAELRTANGDVFGFMLAFPTVRVITRSERPPTGVYREPRFLLDGLSDRNGQAWAGQQSIYTQVRIWFSDSNGQRWLGSLHGDPQREIPIPAPPSWLVGRYRVWKAQREHRLRIYRRRLPFWFVTLEYGVTATASIIVFVLGRVRYWFEQATDFIRRR